MRKVQGQEVGENLLGVVKNKSNEILTPYNYLGSQKKIVSKITRYMAYCKQYVTLLPKTQCHVSQHEPLSQNFITQ